eukprot:Hpha_TRINITY_DN18821_c0_g1::TRINITY_DN18821_c0_g1_i1::g.26308::m.26308
MVLHRRLQGLQGFRRVLLFAAYALVVAAGCALGATSLWGASRPGFGGETEDAGGEALRGKVRFLEARVASLQQELDRPRPAETAVGAAAAPLPERGRAASTRVAPDPATGEPPFRFHIYPVPDKYINGALAELERNWGRSVCNRDVKRKTNYTLLDWRHAHSLFTVDTFIARFLRQHPMHTEDPRAADVFIIPAMTHLYNCAMHMEWLVEIVQWVAGYGDYYRLYDNHDHYMFWWRWGMHYGGTKQFFKTLMKTVPNVNWISFEFLEIMRRNEVQDFTLALKPRFREAQHGVVMPYPDFSPGLKTPVRDPNAPRRYFAFMSGTSTIGGVRRWIKRELDKHADCLYQDFGAHVVDTKRLGVPTEYPALFRDSLFCMHAAGDGLSSRRPTSAVLAGCIPVLVCDLCLYAFENLLNYSSFAVFMPEDDVIGGRMIDKLRSIPPEEIREKQRNLLRVRRHFTYNTSGPPLPGDALDLLVRQLSLRGSILRSYRRWWSSNRQLSSHIKDYPENPPRVNKYKIDPREDPTNRR